MPAVTDLRQQISAALAGFSNQPLREAATDLLATLGYRSDRTISLGDSSPRAFLDFLLTNGGGATFNQEKARNRGSSLCADRNTDTLIFTV